MSCVLSIISRLSLFNLINFEIIMILVKVTNYHEASYRQCELDSVNIIKLFSMHKIEASRVTLYFKYWKCEVKKMSDTH